MKNIYNYPLKTLNTFRVNGIVKRFVEIDTLDNVDYLFDEKLFKGKFLIIGEGSNMLFTDDFEGTIIRIATKGIKKIKETEEHVWLKVEAGETWEDFVNYCISNQYFGVENLIGIPGWVGSAPVQNIGAYGVEVKDVIEKVEGVFIANKEKFIFSSHDCKFGYRDSVFKNKFKNSVIITSVIFKLSKKEYYTLTYKALHDYLQNDSSTISLSAVAKAVLDIRNSKLPDIQKIGSAGSFFKNPIISPKKAEELSLNYPNLSYIPTEDKKIKLSAAQLIDSCGCKAWRQGDIKVYDKQPLVIINEGNATGAAIANFAQQIQEAVKNKYNVILEPEVNII